MNLIEKIDDNRPHIIEKLIHKPGEGGHEHPHIIEKIIDKTEDVIQEIPKPSGTEVFNIGKNLNPLKPPFLEMLNPMKYIQMINNALGVEDFFDSCFKKMCDYFTKNPILSLCLCTLILSLVLPIFVFLIFVFVTVSVTFMAVVMTEGTFLIMGCIAIGGFFLGVVGIVFMVIVLFTFAILGIQKIVYV